MISGDSDNNDGSDIFWPGYVDATTNLILNLLFLLTILIVAVFMFALELGRAVGPQDANVEATVAVEEIVSGGVDPLKENIALKNEVKRLKELLAEQKLEGVPAAGQMKTVEGPANLTKSITGLDKVLPSDFELTIRFKDEAVSFKPTEQAQLLKALKPMAKNKKTLIYVEVPAGFSEAKRMGFYRALTVRNLLLEMKVPAEGIDVSVVEGTTDANASVVKVRSR